ncbi:MAG: radical SAM family heme chaperone HemW [Bacilli bacterium]|nr:radical SAM family heme chaperone HemW [Bacilli bacterium]
MINKKSLRKTKITTKPAIKALYLHIPFCHALCPYCDFPKLLLIKRYVKEYLPALIKELKSLKINHPLKTIYIGGGTPTSINLLPLLKALQPYISRDTEFTIEGNVLDFNPDLLKQYKKYHVNRISLGVQAMDNRLLKVLGRDHLAIDVMRKVALIKRYIKNINVDLIYGFIELSNEALKKELAVYQKLGVKHISTYALEMHPGTKFYSKHKKSMDSAKVRTQFDIIYHCLTKHGYIRYETSNFAKPGFMSKHNLIYWRDEEYYGVGLGAAGYIRGYRYQNTRNIEEYIKGRYHLNKEKVTKDDDKQYYLMLLLRTKDGINLADYKKRFGMNLLLEKPVITSLIKRGLLMKNKTHLFTTYEGSMLLDIILREIF